MAGSFGKVACFSAHPLKNLNALGDSGYLTTNSKKISNFIKDVRNHGMTKRNKIKILAKAGTMYEPWEGDKFDLIIESISAIAKKVAKVSPWYKNGIPCDCGEEGQT